MKLPRTLLRSSVVFLCFAAVISNDWAEEYLSNLGDLWPDPTGNTIGDIEVLDYSYGPFVVQFFTGSGTNDTKRVVGNTNSAAVEAFNLTSASFEFWGGHSQPWSNITIEVSQQVSNQTIVLGELGNAVVNPTPTQWPKSAAGVCADANDVYLGQANNNYCSNGVLPSGTFGQYVNFCADDYTWAGSDSSYFYYAWCDRSRTNGVPPNTRPDADVKFAKIKQ